jgi:hypothetical protein
MEHPPQKSASSPSSLIIMSAARQDVSMMRTARETGTEYADA